MLDNSIEVADIFQQLSDNPNLHRVDNVFFSSLQRVVKKIVGASFEQDHSYHHIDLGGLGSVKVIEANLGNVSSLDVLSSLNEWIILSFYYKNRFKYKTSLDIGANVGIHSLFMGRCNWDVTCFEPDPIHISLLTSNLKLNALPNIRVVESAVSDRVGRSIFRRVIGNTTGSHLIGAKDYVYGPVTEFEVGVVNINDVLQGVDIIKCDVEGHEANIICSISKESFRSTDIFVEIGSHKNADLIFSYCKEIGVNIFSQKVGWAIAANPSDIPIHYSEGSVFISSRRHMPWS